MGAVAPERGGDVARPTKYATPICAAATVIAAIGLLVSLLTKQPLWAIILLIPAAAYEAYRTEGESTRWASWALLVLLVASVALIVFGVSFDLATFFGAEERYVGGQVVPLGDIKVVAPTLMGICAVILFTRTRGKYTRWLAAVIFIASAGIVYTISPEAVADLLGIALDGL